MRLGWAVFLVAGLAAGCASSASGGGDACDEDNPCESGFECVDEVCVEAPDAAVNQFPDAGDFIDASNVDAAPKAGFGEPCSDKSDCESNICILVGVGGICTETCVGGSCPDEFGCFGVFGAIDPGEVADVCVPESNQLCSPCVDSSECAVVGMDRCLSYDNGKQFCARDCATVACPTGYSCETVDVGGTDFEQCIPNSGACDCNAALMGNTEACDIATPLGTCVGQRTCQGATGWGGCEAPSATDEPDATFTDDNCDGIDGDYDDGIFVSRDSGTDGASCGLVHTDPCATIGQGLVRSIVESRRYVFVQASAGSYDEIVTMVVGKHVYGGYDVDWQRGPHTDAAHRVQIQGGLDSGEGQYLTVKAHDLVAETRLADLFVLGPGASGSNASGGRGSYAIHVDNARLRVERVTVIAGNGAAGSGGSTGQPTSSPSATPAMAGKDGGGAAQLADICDTSTAGGGGGAGVNSCSGGSVNPNGGGGGKGGPIDTDCTVGQCAIGGDCNAQSGRNGSHAIWTSSPYGRRGGGGGQCTVGGDATGGRTFNGARGGGANNGGRLVGGYWYAFAGGNGQVGDHGSGGGGGGGSGGCDDGIDSYGAGGGGGGAGGCRATSGGGGGGGGGGSFGIFAVNNSEVTATTCSIQRGNGGDGGQGGPGGHGQRGGPRGDGGAAGDDSKRGGHGGAGGHGGHGGGGGGGAGGVSAGIFYHASSVTHDCTISGGSAGDGGLGGISAPNAPAADDDGNDGQSGDNGQLFTARLCSSAGGC